MVLRLLIKTWSYDLRWTLTGIKRSNTSLLAELSLSPLLVRRARNNSADNVPRAPPLFQFIVVNQRAAYHRNQFENELGLRARAVQQRNNMLNQQQLQAQQQAQALAGNAGGGNQAAQNASSRRGSILSQSPTSRHYHGRLKIRPTHRQLHG